MSGYVFYDIERSFCEYFENTLSKGANEVTAYEFPVSELGSHTYSVEFISDASVVAGQGRAIEGTSHGRFIDSLVQVDVFRLPTSGRPDVGGAKDMLSKVSNLFKGTHYIPYKSYGTAATDTTTGTTVGAIKVKEVESVKQAFDPDPNIRRYSLTYNLRVKEVF